MFCSFIFLKNDKVYKESAKREKDKSISRGAPIYLYDLAQKNWMKKSQNMPVCLRKMGLAQHNCRVPGKIG
jgi:hypothetical protein